MGRRMRGALAAVLTLMSVTDGHAQTALAGAWTGKAFQLLADGQTVSWTINMRIDALGNATSIDYPTLNCGGSLAYLRAIGDIREYRETLSYGLERCTNNGTVGFRQKLGKLIWYWSGEGTKNPTGIDVAVLTRSTQ
jgi:hypothetical protein